MSKEKSQDPYIGLQPIPNYYLTEKVDEGSIGSVYKAVKTDSEGEDILACKIIPEGGLRYGWEREVQKIRQLRGVPNVVPYHTHGTSEDKNYRPYNYILFDYIPSTNLRKYLNNPTWPLDMAFIENIIKTVLQVLHACRAVKIQHGDLHEGNILISEPDKRLPGSPRTIWISDFGYGGSHNKRDPKDDYRQLFSIASNLLRKLNRSDLNPRDRSCTKGLKNF